MKRMLTLLLAALMLLTMPACAAREEPTQEATGGSILLAAASESGEFSDVPADAWYTGAVAYVSENGLMNGMGEGRFDPNGTFTRAQLATVLYRIAGEPSVGAGDSFLDVVPDAWYAKSAAWAKQSGVINGVGDGRFGSDIPVTQEMLVTMLWRMEKEPQSEAASDASGYAAEAVGWARTVGIASEAKDYAFAPRENASRAQVAMLLYRYKNREAALTTTTRTLVAYFSATGNTKPMAEDIAGLLDADLYEIIPEEPYTEADLVYYTDCRADREQNDPAARPAINGRVENMDRYDTVVIGHPIWHGQAPRIISTFLESYDFSGKTLVTFCTSHSSGLGSSAENLHALVPERVTWLESRRFPAGASREHLKDWLEEIGLYSESGGETVGCFNFETKTVLLNSGYPMPILGLGTYALDHEACVSSVKALLKNGGRLIDTAYMYHNEEAVGEGVRQAMEEYGIPREDIFVITKIYPSQFSSPEAAIDMALDKLNIGYIDMMLLHHPGTGDVAAYQAMEEYVEQGKIRSLGLSNWYVKELTDFLPQVTITPALVQNEIHPYYQERDVVPFIQEKGIVVQCWYPLGGRGHTATLLGDETIKTIAEAHGVSSAQVILRWDLQRGIAVIPGSSDPKHIKENLDLFGFALTGEEMEAIAALDRGEKHDWY